LLARIAKREIGDFEEKDVDGRLILIAVHPENRDLARDGGGAGGRA
jgi:hypothetical protein